jgi:phosphatidylglycerol lysyltransferase
VRRYNVRVTAGSPICSPERLADAALEFERDATIAGERVCYFATEAPLQEHYRSCRGYAAVLLGAQPVWHPRHWASSVACHASLRAQLNRARNKGVVVSEWHAERAKNHPALQRCLRQWLATRRLPTLHFLVEPETLARLFDRRIFVAARDGEVVGFVVATPIPQRNGYLIEQVVRGARAPNGTAEMMIDAGMSALATDGFDYATLGLAPLSRRCGVPDGGHPLWLRTVLSGVRSHGRCFFDFDGLDAFKAKFRPECWEPVYAVCNDSSFSPKMLYAIAGAFTEGSPLAAVIRSCCAGAVRSLRLARRDVDLA